MSTIRQLTYVGPNELEWREVTAPVIETNRDALVRPLAVARCDLDLYIAMGLYRTPGPFAFGHEMTGVVTEVGDAVSTVRPGDRVVVPFQINCGECSNCMRGWTNACTAVPPFAAYGLGTHRERDFGGALSDSVRVPFADAMLVQLPEGLSPEAACGLGDNVADGYRTVAENLARFPGEAVLVAGGLAQSVGLYAVLSARALGAERVTYTDFDDTRLGLAEAAGAQAIRVDYTATKRADRDYLVTVDTSGTPEGLSYALRSTAPCGFCTGVSGGLGSTVELPLNSMYMRGITYDVGRVHGRAVLPNLLEHVVAGRIDPLAVLTRRGTFDDALEAVFDPSPKVILSRGG